jgi:hypothetical protein
MADPPAAAFDGRVACVRQREVWLGRKISQAVGKIDGSGVSGWGRSSAGGLGLGLDQVRRQGGQNFPETNDMRDSVGLYPRASGGLLEEFAGIDQLAKWREVQSKLSRDKSALSMERGMFRSREGRNWL